MYTIIPSVWMTSSWFYEYAVGLMFIVHTTKLQTISVPQRCHKTTLHLWLFWSINDYYGKHSGRFKKYTIAIKLTFYVHIMIVKCISLRITDEPNVTIKPLTRPPKLCCFMISARLNDFTAGGFSSSRAPPGSPAPYLRPLLMCNSI